MTPPLHVQNGSGFHSWMSTPGENTTPPTRKVAPNCVAVAKAFAQDPTSAKARPRSQTPRHHHLQRRCPIAPQKPHQRGINASAARGSRIAASATTPSDGAAYGAGPNSTARATPPHVEIVASTSTRLHRCRPTLAARGVPHRHGLHPCLREPALAAGAWRAPPLPPLPAADPGRICKGSSGRNRRRLDPKEASRSPSATPPTTASPRLHRNNHHARPRHRHGRQAPFPHSGADDPPVREPRSRRPRDPCRFPIAPSSSTRVGEGWREGGGDNGYGFLPPESPVRVGDAGASYDDHTCTNGCSILYSIPLLESLAYVPGGNSRFVPVPRPV
jgi:hypothetical protein